MRIGKIGISINLSNENKKNKMRNIYNNKSYKCNIKTNEFEIIKITNDRDKKMIKL
jgi:hypothetical protein